MAGKEKKSLGASLVEGGIISAEQLKHAQDEETRTGQRLRTILVRLGYIEEDDLVSFLSEKHSIPKIELETYLIDPKIIDIVPEELARKHSLIPVLKIGNRLMCAMLDPLNIFALDELSLKTNLLIEPAVATEIEIRKAIDEHYGSKGTIDELIKKIDKKEFDFTDDKELDLKKLEGIAEEPTVIKLVNIIIMQALKEKASDIHLEPEENELKTRFRVDGMLHEVSSPPKYLQSAVISRIKIMANLDIAERRLPQDGRFHMKIDGKDVDVRVSCMPTIYGENIVMRLLEASSAFLTLENLGFSNEILGIYQGLIKYTHGIILVTGPTGSGKTTTLYSSLDKINTVEKNIITIEDPVEYKLEGIRQIQVNPKVGLEFANGLRSILRQDPDIIMVGEMRDHETAEIAVQAALTGHLVFSTLHTNDAPGAINRMVDMGIEPFLISSSLIGVLAQRLVRKICVDCKEEYRPVGRTIDGLDLLDDKDRSKIKFYRGKGCSNCSNKGYKGRVGIYELMLINDDIRAMIMEKAPTDLIRKKAISSGMISLRSDGVSKLAEGITTIEEILRVTRE